MGTIEIPSMPVVSDYVIRHRPRISAYMNVFNAMVVRTVKRKEMFNTPAAMKAMDDEWDNKCMAMTTCPNNEWMAMTKCPNKSFGI